jgi:tetratricopeptide (TPR) repeat protein
MILSYERYQIKSQKKRKKFFLIIGVPILAAGLVAGFLLLPGAPDKPAATREDIDLTRDPAVLWENRQYDDIILICDYYLEQRPLDQYYLIYRGFSYFYKAWTEIIKLFSNFFQETPSAHSFFLLRDFTSFYDLYSAKLDEGTVNLLNQAIISLRRVLLTDNVGIKHQVYYILGKAYFLKGIDFLDLSIKYLELAVKEGNKEYDLYEYLATAYEVDNQIENAIRFLKDAYAEKPLDQYVYYLAKYYALLKQYDKAEQNLHDIIEKSKDKDLIIECRLLLGNIYFDKKEYNKAKDLYTQVIQEYEGSEAAHFQLALVYENLGDYAKYRAELRKAYRLNPKNEEARRRLYDTH